MFSGKNRRHNGNNHSSHTHHHHNHNSSGELVRDAFGSFLGAMLDEANYQAEKKRLIENIERLKTQALIHDTQGNYASAIGLYDEALREAGHLNSIWARHQWHLGNRYSYSVCTHHSRYVGEINVLRNAVVSKQQAALAETQRLRQIEIAKEREAQRLRDAEATRQRTEQDRSYWQKQRITIPHAALLKRAANAGLDQAQAILIELNQMCVIYQNSILHHIGNDSEILQQLKAEKNRLDSLIFQDKESKRLLRESESDNKLQESIHRDIYGVLDALDIGDIPGALRALLAIQLAVKFHNIENIQGQARTPASVFIKPIKELIELKQEYDRSAKAYALSYAKQITKLVQHSGTNTTTPGKNRLYSSYEIGIETTIQEKFQENWKSFNARSAPEDLILQITAQIVARFKPIGNKRWAADLLTFSGWPNLSLQDYDSLLLEVAASIKNYVPQSPILLQKPLLDAFLQPYMEERNKTCAFVGQSDANVPMASYADSQSSGQKGSFEYNMA